MAKGIIVGIGRNLRKIGVSGKSVIIGEVVRNLRKIGISGKENRWSE